MGKRFTKKQAVAIAISAARQYRDRLVGKRLLFVATDKHRKVYALQVRFTPGNFQHLTGLLSTDSSWTPVDFYNHCVNGRLREKDITFHENGTTDQKLSVLPHVFRNANLSANMIGNYNQSHPVLYTEKLVGGVKWSIGFRQVAGFDEYVPDTLLEGDIRNKVFSTYRIVATYIRDRDEAQFTRLIYKAKQIEYSRLKYPDDWGDLPRVVEE